MLDTADFTELFKVSEGGLFYWHRRESRRGPLENVERRWIGGALQPVPTNIRESISPIIEDYGCELVGVDVAQEGNRRILWVYIDRPGAGATIDDCAQLSPEVSALLDVTDPIAESYELRVSSPGLDRPLMSGEDFERFAGDEAQVVLSTPIRGRKKFTGRIVGVAGDDVQLECSDGLQSVPLVQIQRAKLKYELKIGKDRPA